MIINYKKLSSKMTVMAAALLITMGFVFFTLTGFVEIKVQDEFNQNEQGIQRMEDERMTTEGQAAMAEASEALQNEDFATAEKILENYLATNPTYRPDILYSMLGSAYLNQQKLYDAADVFGEAYDIYPDKTDFLTNQTTSIVMHAQKNDDKLAYIEGAKLFEKCYELIPGKDIENLRNAALCYFSAENYKEAKRVFERLNQLSGGTDIDVIKALYQISNYLEQTDEASFYAQRLEEMGESLSASVAPSDISKEEQEETESHYNEGDAYGLDEVDEPPQVLRKVIPPYPFLAKRENIEGRVLLRFVVTKEGFVAEPEVIESEPAGVFDEAALVAIEQYFFEPATIHGEPVNCIVNAPMAFVLE